MIKFKEEFKDVVDVEHVSAYCFGAKDEVNPERIKFAGGGNKFSSMCGFRFISKVNPTYNHGEFKIVFCTKLRSKIYRIANQNPSQWFAFLQIGKNHVEVLDKDSCMKAFDFDVDKFFQTDYFFRMTDLFRRVANEGIAEAEKIAAGQKPDSDEYEWLPRYIKAIKESLPIMKEGRFNDKQYTLTMDFADPRKKSMKKHFDPKGFEKFIRSNTGERKSPRRKDDDKEV